MAETVKRRVAAARLAVAFVAAGAIAGATTWANATPPPPTAQASAVDAFLKIKGLTGENIKDGSLYLQDIHRGQVASFKQFAKLDAAFNHFKKAVTNNYLTEKQSDARYVKIDSTDYIKRSDLQGYIKLSEADARYRKLNENVVLGDGSVFTGDGLVSNTLIGLLDVPNLVKIEGVAQKVRLTNTSSGDIQHSACTDAQGATIPPGTLKPGDFIECDAGRTGFTQSMQLFTGGVRPAVVTVSFTSIPAGGGTSQDTVQVLVGL